MKQFMEKYRPKEFKDIIGLDPKIINCVKIGDIPHFLFSGPAGTGKTTTALAIVNALGVDVLQLNASNERGIDTIREKVNTFAMTMSTNGKLKVVFLDEADALTKDAQTSLRNIMETYYSNCRFILTCNYINRIIDPLQSRCHKYKISLPDNKAIYDRLTFICEKENINIEEKLLKKIIEKFYPDIRECVNFLEELSYLDRPITIEDINKNELIVEEVFKMFSENKRFTEIRQYILDTNIDYKNTLKEIYLYIFRNLKLYASKFEKIILAIADCDSKLNISTHEEIQFALLLWRLKKILSENVK